MPTRSHPFAPPLTVDGLGLVATTADLDPKLLIAGYFLGLFPWTDEPVGWFCPPERGVLLPHQAHFPRNLTRLMRKARFIATCDQAFERIIRACAAAHAHEGVWITPRFERAYSDLHQQGHAHSIEIWQDDVLVGGLYGVQTGEIFSAESMFALTSNASKAAVWFLVNACDVLGVRLIDVQVLGATTEALGARQIPREMYLELLEKLRPHAPGASSRTWPKESFSLPSPWAATK